ncbi:MAG: hypothetical protein FWE67_12280 [Planctomycetaceae bacterium]|nr:hypothetical protein [Planctomycetaceae bacterium]
MSFKRVFSKIAARTHMPFYSGGMLVFCMNESPAVLRTKTEQESEYRPWRIYRADWTTKSIVPVQAEMPDNAVLCNPMFFTESGMLNVSFIAGIPYEAGFRYKLYAMQGASWETLSSPVPVGEQSARTGFVSPRHFCLGGERMLNLLDKSSHQRYRLTVSLDAVARVTFDPQQPERLLITGNKSGLYKTLLFDTETKSVSEFSGPAPVYKACLVGNRIVFSYRESEEVEDFQLYAAPLVLQPSEETVSMCLV